MDNSRELASLLRRANRLSIIQQPPTLEMVIMDIDDEKLGQSQWQLTLAIEPKREKTT
jgi:hypothetical protein